MIKYILASFIMCAGIFAAFCAVMNYDWFMKNGRALRVTMIFGRKGARVFYVLLGVCIAAGGVALLKGAAAGTW
ncbi:MAG: hypothetical protein DELT_01437 [Desulfovibrio sp.]